MKKIFLILGMFSTLLFAEITPSDVFAEVKQIEKELHIIKEYYHIEKDSHITKLTLELEPRHVVQKTYELLVKINILRAINNLLIVEPVNYPPTANTQPELVYEHTKRVLTELQIFKERMGISEKATPLEVYKNKRPIDVYNQLSHVSKDIDIINGSKFTPSHTYAEAMRVYDDVSLILRRLDIPDRVHPPMKNTNATSTEAFNSTMKILDKIKEINLLSNNIDFHQFKNSSIVPSDVFTLIQMVIAELQVLKAQIGLNQEITPAGRHYSEKTSSDVEQLMSWNLKRISEISSAKAGY